MNNIKIKLDYIKVKIIQIIIEDNNIKKGMKKIDILINKLQQAIYQIKFYGDYYTTLF